MAFQTELLRSACTHEATMKKTWGAACPDIALCLAAIGAAATLLDLASMRMCSLAPLKGTARKASTFRVSRRSTEVHLRAVDLQGRPMTVPVDEDGLAAIRSVLLLAVVRARKTTGQTVPR